MFLSWEATWKEDVIPAYAPAFSSLLFEGHINTQQPFSSSHSHRALSIQPSCAPLQVLTPPAWCSASLSPLQCKRINNSFPPSSAQKEWASKGQWNMMATPSELQGEEKCAKCKLDHGALMFCNRFVWCCAPSTDVPLASKWFSRKIWGLLSFSFPGKNQATFVTAYLSLSNMTELSCDLENTSPLEVKANKWCLQKELISMVHHFLIVTRGNTL